MTQKWNGLYYYIKSFLLFKQPIRHLHRMWELDESFCSLGGVLCGDPWCRGDSGAVSGGRMEERKKIIMVEILQCGVRVVKRYVPPFFTRSSTSSLAKRPISHRCRSPDWTDVLSVNEAREGVDVISSGKPKRSISPPSPGSDKASAFRALGK